MEGQQVAFRKIDLKEENYKKQRKNQLSETGWHNRGSGTQGAKGGKSMVS